MTQDHPIDEYLEALEAYQKGSPDAALKVTRALGGQEPTEPIKRSLAKIFDRESPLHQGVIGVMISEARRREKHG
jgi:hypothetical protein